MEVLFAEQKVMIKTITNSLDNFRKIGKSNLTYGIVRSRLQKLKSDYARFEQNHVKILASASDELIAGHKYFTEDWLSACEAAYFAASDYMADWEAQLEPQSTSTPNASSVSQRQQPFASRSALQLPRINLPRFSGDLSAWESFRDQFKALIIDNPDLVNVNRLQYLHSCLKDDAFDIVRNLSLTDANFQVAWDLLIARYDNKRRLVHEHIHALVTLPHITSESASALSALRDKSNVAIKALSNLGRAVDTWDDILVYLIVQRFDKATRKAWELHIGDTSEYPSFQKLEQFLASRIRALENILPSLSPGNHRVKTFSVQSHTANTNIVRCPLCQKSHFLYACPNFRSKTLTERRELAQKFRCCYNCLSIRHTRNTCQSKSRCRQCQQNHHTLLHDSAIQTATIANASASGASNRESTTIAVNNHVLATHGFSKSSILLATATVTVYGLSGRRESVRALLDQGSVTSLISERLAQRLRLKRTRVSVSITGVGESKSSATHAAHIRISPRHSSTTKLPVKALILKTLTAYTPPRRKTLTNLDHLRYLPLADDDPTSSEPIDLVIGADLYGSVLHAGFKAGKTNEPVAQRTIFGWILSGPTPSQTPAHTTALTVHNCTVHEGINERLKLSSNDWPQTSLSDASDSHLEARPRVPVHLQQISEDWNLHERFSSWSKLLRVTAYILRFVSRLRNRENNQTFEPRVTSRGTATRTSLNANEIIKARIFWLKRIQRTLFPREYHSLQSGHSLSSRSALISLNPYLDKDELIRVGGRLRHSTLPSLAKNPIVLASHPLVTALIRDIHLNALHAGPQLTLASLREEFWVLRARQTVRAVIHKCITCTRERAAVATEQMGDLPDFRVSPMPRVFTHTGIDFAGPIQLRSTPGRGHKAHKAYIAVFVCMTVKATHLELVNDLSSQAFLAAFARFCSRRGVPSAVYSDNATNFQGAQRELAATWHAVTSDSNLLVKTAEQGVTWKFIPPASPHFGGVWEACVRSVKYHLRRVIGCHTLTHEEMSTLLCKIEACLNSRPLGQLSDHIDDYTALTPNHFLVGSTITSVPESSLHHEKEARLTRWQLVQQMRESFWKRWSSDYVHTLQQRPKWRSAHNLAQVGRLVLLRNSLAPPCAWELGRIEECHPGADGLSRVVTVKTARSRYKRAISKLCFLPIDINTVN